MCIFDQIQRMSQVSLSIASAASRFNLVLGLVAFLPLAFPKLVTLAVVLLAVSVVYLYVRKEIAWQFNWSSAALIGLYLVYLVWILWAEDKANGLKYAEYKLSFLLFPLLLSIRPKFNLRLDGAVTGLIAGVLVASIPGIMDSFHCVDEHNRFLFCYTSSRISVVHHPSYFAAFLLVAVVGAWHGYRQQWAGYSGWAVVLFSAFAMGFYFLCLSLAGMLYLLIFLLGLGIFFIIRRVGKRAGIALSLLSPAIAIGVLWFTPGVKEEFRNTLEWTGDYLKSPSAYLEARSKERELQSNHIRLVMWTVTAKLVAEHPTGVGTGDVDRHLHKRLLEYGFVELVEQDLNAHNQYLQTALETGVLGLGMLLLFIGSSLRTALREKSLLLLVLVSGFAFNALFESFFQRQSGVVFYSFWIPFIILYVRCNQKSAESKE